MRARIDAIYQEQGLEYQRVFDELLESELGHIDPKILASGIVAYRRARGSALVLYPARPDDAARADQARHPARRRVRRAARARCGCGSATLALQHVFDAVVTFDDTRRAQAEPGAVPRGAAAARRRRRSESLMVGDWAERDVVGGKSLGMKTVFARYGDTFDTTGVGRGLRHRRRVRARHRSWTGSNGATPTALRLVRASGARTPASS